MELTWKLYSSVSRDGHKCLVRCAHLGEGAYVWRTEWYRLGERAHWIALNEWSAGTPDELVKERFGLTREGCKLDSLDKLITVLNHQLQAE